MTMYGYKFFQFKISTRKLGRKLDNNLGILCKGCKWTGYCYCRWVSEKIVKPM